MLEIKKVNSKTILEASLIKLTWNNGLITSSMNFKHIMMTIATHQMPTINHSQQHTLSFAIALKNNYFFFYYVYNYLITKIII
jgi:hypothetical protein